MTWFKYLLPAVVVIVLWILWPAPEPETPDISKYIENTRKAKQRADSLENELDMLVSHYVRLQKSYSISIEEVNEWKKRYNYERKRKTPILTDAAYDSVINRLYPR